MPFVIPAPVLAATPSYYQWAALGILLLISLFFAVFTLFMSSLLGPSRKGVVKDRPYESGVDPVGSTKRRFNVRFYLVAMIFLVFDVEVLFFVPWVTIFKDRLNPVLGIAAAPLFSSVVIFVLIILVAYNYALGKGVFKWD